MKFAALRRYIISKNLSSPHILENCKLVIDGDSFFRHTYRNSGCQFVLGPDCDRYAEFIIKTLRLFVDNDVECYVIFSGETKYDEDRRKVIHQKVIDDRYDIARIDMAGYFQPLFIEDVQKQVLDELNIKYFVCEYNSLEALVGVARKLKCPVLTKNIEYSCFGMSCITQNSLDKVAAKLTCTIYEHEKVKTAIGVYSKMPILLTLLNDSGDLLEALADTIEDGDSDDIWPVIRWVKRQKEATVFSTVSRSIDDKNIVCKKVYEKIQTIYLYPLCNLAMKYFQKDKAHDVIKDDKKWLSKGVSNGRIAVPYINLKKKGLIHGSLLMNDSERPDALLAAIDIIVYSHCLLTNSQDSTISFIGRKGKKTSIKEIETHWNKDISNRDIFTKLRVGKKCKLVTKAEAFEQFLEEVLPGYDYEKPFETIPKECMILIITLVYYVHKKNNDFINCAYCILLSYLMLGPVSRLVRNLKKNGQDFSLTDTEKDATTFYNDLQFLFDKVNLRQTYNTTVVHNLSEFQHCLQHMNYLNKLCGEKFPCTVYHVTYNATFIYNTLLFMTNKNELMQFMEKRFRGSIFLKEYKTIVTSFENCLSVISLKKKLSDSVDHKLI